MPIRRDYILDVAMSYRVHAWYLLYLVRLPILSRNGLDDILQLLLSQDLKPSIRRDLLAQLTRVALGERRSYLGKLHIVLVQLLLHDLLEHLQSQLVSLDQGHLLGRQLLCHLEQLHTADTPCDMSPGETAEQHPILTRSPWRRIG